MSEERVIRDILVEYRRIAIEQRLSPRDVDLLLAHVLRKSATWLIAHDDEPVADALLEQFDRLLERRLDGEPLQYLRGFTEFYGRDFVVDSRVLIPRPETELLVEHVLARAPERARILDIGTGSGCIATTLQLERKGAQVTAVDISIDALALARANAQRLGATVRFAASDVADAVDGEFDVLASNPPYIPSSHLSGLQREVRDHEPYCALTPGTNGTEVIERIFMVMPRLLPADGFLAMEIGYSQSADVYALAARHGIEIEQIAEDLAGIPRVVIARSAR